jgi:glyoxylase-like metal-dependent hydrolase (beta-lactamase superfamily II)
LVLVDAAWPNKADAILEGVRQTGHDPADIKHLLLTHGHVDHAGSAAEISRRIGAKVYVHAADLALTDQRGSWIRWNYGYARHYSETRVSFRH